MIKYNNEILIRHVLKWVVGKLIVNWSRNEEKPS